MSPVSCMPPLVVELTTLPRTLFSWLQQSANHLLRVWCSNLLRCSIAVWSWTEFRLNNAVTFNPENHYLHLMLEFHALKSPCRVLRVLCQLCYSLLHVADNGPFLLWMMRHDKPAFWGPVACLILAGLFSVSLCHHPRDSLQCVLLGLHCSNVQKYWVDSCNKTNKMHEFLRFIFGLELYMFRTVSLSLIRLPMMDRETVRNM
jgi:hypothetical protein